MKSNKRRVFLSIFLLQVFFTVTNSVLATVDEAPTGTVVEYCSLSFEIDSTTVGSKHLSSDVRVLMEDISTGKEYLFLLKADNDYDKGREFQILSNTTYKVTTSYNHVDEGVFEVINADGSKISSYHATTSGLTLLWKIKKAQSNAVNVSHGEESDDELVDVVTMLKRYINKTNFIENDPNFEPFLNSYTSAIMKKQYLTLKGNSMESWNTMSVYEQATYMILYGIPHQRILGGNGAEYTKNKAVFLNGLMFAETLLLNAPKGDVVYDAVIDAWEWHYDNWTTTHIMVNPFDQCSFDEIMADKSLSIKEDNYLDPIKEIKENEDVSNTVVEEPKDLMDKGLSNMNDVPEKKNSEKLSSPSNYFQIFWENKFSIIILIVVSITVFIVSRKNRKKNIDDILGD